MFAQQKLLEGSVADVGRRKQRWRVALTGLPCRLDWQEGIQEVLVHYDIVVESMNEAARTKILHGLTGVHRFL